MIPITLCLLSGGRRKESPVTIATSLSRKPGRPPMPPGGRRVTSSVSLTPGQWARLDAILSSYHPDSSNRPQSRSALLGRLVDEAFKSCPFLSGSE